MDLVLVVYRLLILEKSEMVSECGERQLMHPETNQRWTDADAFELTHSVGSSWVEMQHVIGHSFYQ